MSVERLAMNRWMARDQVMRRVNRSPLVGVSLVLAVHLLAAGSATAEMTMEGLPSEKVRDYLYVRMRDARRGSVTPRDMPAGGEASAIVEALHETAAELRKLREAISSKGSRT